MVRGLLGFWGWDSLYKHKRINPGKKTLLYLKLIRVHPAFGLFIPDFRGVDCCSGLEPLTLTTRVSASTRWQVSCGAALRLYSDVVCRVGRVVSQEDK